MDGAVGECEIGREVAEQVERQRLRREEVGPRPLVVEGLVALDRRGSAPRRGEGVGREEGRAGLLAEVERKPAADEPRRRAVGLGRYGCVPIGWPWASRHSAWW